MIPLFFLNLYVLWLFDCTIRLVSTNFIVFAFCFIVILFLPFIVTVFGVIMYFSPRSSFSEPSFSLAGRALCFRESYMSFWFRTLTLEDFIIIKLLTFHHVV